MPSPREVLNRLRWEAPGGQLAGVLLYYRHRGAPDDMAVLRGEDILHVGQSFLDLPEGARLPMHRILRVERGGEVLWDRKRDARSSRDEAGVARGGK